MNQRRRHRLQGLRRLATLTRHWFLYDPVGQFTSNVARLIWQYRAYSAAIILLTIVQEFAALWPVSLLGEFIDRLDSGDLGQVVWLFLFASLLYPGLVRGNIILRHRMLYQTDYQKMVELVLRASDAPKGRDSEEVGTEYTRLANAVAGITNATFHILGGFTPIIFKIIIVSGRLLAYNRLLGLVYTASLVVPAALTVVFNQRLRFLLDAHYALGGEVSGAAMRVISEGDDLDARARYGERMHVRRSLLQKLVAKGQFFTYLREAALVASQFLVVFMALALRTTISITPGDFARIIGYTTQVAAAFVGAVASLDAIVSYTRAYHVYATRGRTV